VSTQITQTHPRLLYARFTALPGQRDAVAALVRDLSDRVRKEPGNVHFAVTTKAEDPDAFFVFEEYRDDAAFNEHLGADYVTQFNVALADLIVEDGSVLTWLVPV
jgi:quinol monooxygenase YgiN